MKPLVELASAWEDFTAQNNHEISVKAFCEFYLNNTTSAQKQPASKEIDQELAKVIGRLGAIHKTYAKMAFRQLPGVELEWYFLLHTIQQAGSIRKTEVISFNLLLEPTTCIDIINRMIKAGLVNEKTDMNDKRARLLQISQRGELLLKSLQLLVDETNATMYEHLAPDDKKYLIQLLSAVATQHAAILLGLNRKNTAKPTS